MSESKPKKYSAFLSYAEPDLDLAEALYNLLRSLLENPFFAARTLQRVGGKEWRQTVVDGIAQSATFVAIYTRKSIRRPWVLFESGVAEAHGVLRLPARTASVSISNIEPIGKDVPVYDLSDKDSLLELLSLIFASQRQNDTGDARHKIKRVIEQLGEQNRFFKRVIDLSKDRWIFVAGNTPTEKDIEELIWCKKHGDSVKEQLDHVSNELANYTKTLSTALFENGFNVMSCPQVPLVGRQTALSYMEYLKFPPPEISHYRIGGLYPIDRDLRKAIGGTAEFMETFIEGDLGKELDEEWARHLMEFRLSYLAEMEWLILLGGSVGTREEHLAGMEIDTKPCPIPFFGGTALKIWKVMNSDNRPFSDWTPDREVGSVEDVIKYIEKQ